MSVCVGVGGGGGAWMGVNAREYRCSTERQGLIQTDRYIKNDATFVMYRLSTISSPSHSKQWP